MCEQAAQWFGKVAEFEQGQTRCRQHHMTGKQRGYKHNSIDYDTVEPLYNGHFGTSHFWDIFSVI